MENINKSKKNDTKAKIIILVVTLVLTILFATLAGVIGTSYDSDNGNGGSSRTVSGTLSTGNNTVRLTGSNYVYYRFTPSVSGNYVFTCSSSLDTYATLYSSSWSTLTYDDESGSGNNFRIAYSLQANRTYYLGVRLYSGNTNTTVTVTVSRS